MAGRLKKQQQLPFLPFAVKKHSFNKDCSQVAVVGDLPEIYIFQVEEGVEPSKWKQIDKLVQHNMAVTGIHWGKTTDRIVSCSEDRRAFVWERSGKGWQAQLLQLPPSSDRACLTCEWNGSENKIAIGTGSKRTNVCYMDKGSWFAKDIKFSLSSVTSVAWHPKDDALLVTGGTDSYIRLFSTYLKAVEGKREDAHKFGTELASHYVGGWVHDLSFSPDGTWVAAATHDSSIHFFKVEDNEIKTYRTSFLPFTSVLFVNPTTCLAAGNDFYPMCYKLAGDEWKLQGEWKGSKKAAEKSSGTQSIMAKFQAEAKFGAGGGGEQESSTKHQNCISSLGLMKDGSKYTFTTTGLEGEMYVWESDSMTPIA